MLRERHPADRTAPGLRPGDRRVHRTVVFDVRRRGVDLKEVEHLTLTILQGRGTMIVGDIQRLLGVLPAQMSRIIRALENRDRPLITCSINPRDKRKIDVCLTSHGEKLLLEYQTRRVDRIVERLQNLSDDDQEELIRALTKLHGLL